MFITKLQHVVNPGVFPENMEARPIGP